MKWNPIETAPRKTPVLVWGGEEISVAEFNGRDWLALVDGSYAWEGDGETGGISRISMPTHWMPLPAPPDDESSQRKAESFKALMSMKAPWEGK